MVARECGRFRWDPRKVAIWGKSADGFRVAQQLITYGGTGEEELFRGALLVAALRQAYPCFLRAQRKPGTTRYLMLRRVPPHGRHPGRLILGYASSLHGERVGVPTATHLLFPLRHGPNGESGHDLEWTRARIRAPGAELAYEFGLPAGFRASINFDPPVKNVPTHLYLSHSMVRWCWGYAIRGP